MRKPFARFCSLYDESGREFPACWHVEALHPSGLSVVDEGFFNETDETPLFTFASRRDAELAAKALNDAGLDTAEKLIEAGWEKVKRTMCEALMW